MRIGTCFMLWYYGFNVTELECHGDDSVAPPFSFVEYRFSFLSYNKYY
jgi:hypothetical protein